MLIDTVSIISDGGVVLWQHSAHPTGRRAMINRLIQEVFLEGRAGVREHVIDDCRLRWVLQNEANFFVVVVYPKFLTPHYMDDYLQELATVFTAEYAKQTTGVLAFTTSFDFAEHFRALTAKLEASERGSSDLAYAPDREMDSGAAGEEQDELTEVVDAGRAGQPSQAEADIPGGGAKVILTKDGRRLVVRGGAATGSAGRQPQQKKKRASKTPTTWGSPSLDPEVEKQAKQAVPTEAELRAQTEIQRATYIKRLPNGSVAPVREKVWEDQPRGRLANWLRTFVGSREVDQQDLTNVIPSLREKLIGKNVAVEVADNVCQSVETSLRGKRLGTFDSLYATVDKAMVTALRRILQPKREVNILRDVAAAKARKKPYTIVLCGVNGVGKSTSLAKIAYWLQQNGNSLLVAAGDTFRHGAVEQLEVHGRCLGVPVFQMGYGADPSAVTAAAIAQASRQHVDVVMVDTAGRMQDHESRMRALAKLIHDNQPDLVLFVGEALVGNNGVEQLRKFNQCLVDFAPVHARPRGIDGIVLTKFDTIDDKVGAALSMVYELSQPIVFVGVGQTYQDLKVIEPDVVVSALMQ